MNVDQRAKQFWEHGVLHIPGFCNPDMMDRLDSVIHTHFGAAPEWEHTEEFLEKSKVEVIPWFPQQAGERAFDAIEQDPRLRALTRAVLGKGFSAQYCMVMFSKAGSNGQAWHQDCPPDDPARHNLNRLIYTRDITEDTGGQLVFVPGSHHNGELPAGDPTADIEGQCVLAPKKGDLVILHGHAWHRVLPTCCPRSSTNFRAGPAGTPDGITDICVYRNMRYRFSTREIIQERV